MTPAQVKLLLALAKVVEKMAVAGGWTGYLAAARAEVQRELDNPPEAR